MAYFEYSGSAGGEGRSMYLRTGMRFFLKSNVQNELEKVTAAYIGLQSFLRSGDKMSIHRNTEILSEVLKCYRYDFSKTFVEMNCQFSGGSLYLK